MSAFRTGKILAKPAVRIVLPEGFVPVPQPLTSTSMMRLQKCAKLCTRTPPKFLEMLAPDCLILPLKYFPNVLYSIVNKLVN